MTVATASLLFAVAVPVSAQDAADVGAASVGGTGWNPETGIYEMVFPVDDNHAFSNTWGACRAGCSRRHEGTDIFAAKMTPVFAVAAGTIGWMHDNQGGNCCAMALEHDDGWASWSIHLNNDTPGTDDGQGWGFAPGIASGVHVEAGELIGWAGDSGNAESTAPHVHFELHRPDGTKINPYPHLVAAEQAEGSGVTSFSSYRVDDGPEHDGTGDDSKGNNNGIAECGETIEFYATVMNTGEEKLSNLTATLDVSDPFVTRLYNRQASYPSLDPSEAAENPRDWDLEIASDVSGGHHFEVTLTYTASFGGPWIVDIAVPISCGADVTPPQVRLMTPHHGEFAVALDRNIVAEFNEPVEPTSVTNESFSVADGTVVTGALTVSPDGMSATFDPDSDLAADAVYSVVLSDSITDLAANPLQPTAWTFSTGDIVSGSVIDISYRVDDGPLHDGTGDDSVGNNDGAVQCGETVEIYVTARNEGDIALFGLSGAFSESDPYGRLLYNINAPYPDLAPGASAENLGDWDLKIDADTPVGYVFAATVKFSLLDPVSLSLYRIESEADVEIPIECSAPSVTEISPHDGDVDVSVGAEIQVTFSKSIAADTVTTDTFTLDGGSPVPGTVTVAGNRKSATFTADTELDYQTEYAISINDGIVDNAGNPVTPDSSSFITQELDTTPPQVIGVDPADAMPGVAVSSDVTVTFSEPVDPATVTVGSFEVANGGPISGSVSVAGDALSATFVPDISLAHETSYQVSVGSGIADPAGNAVTPFTSLFTTLPRPSDPGRPAFLSQRVDDGPEHDGTGNDSKGNNDEAVQCGETIELYVTVENVGELGLSGLSGLLIASDPFVTVLYNTSALYPGIGGGSSAENFRDWDLRISPDAPEGHVFDFTVRFSAVEGGPWDVEATLPIGCEAPPDPDGPGAPVLASYRVDDGPGHDDTGNDSKGNDDGIAQCGETIELYVTLGNSGENGLSGLSGLLLDSDPYLALLYNSSASYPDLASGASGENPRDWDLVVSSDAPDGHEFSFILRVTDDTGGSWDIEVNVPISCGAPDPVDPGLPSFVDVRVDDGPTHDGTGSDSKGNNDGVAQCGEVIEVYVRMRNVGGEPLTGLSALLVESDPHLTLLYNDSTTYPDLVAGADAENPRDWDIKVADTAPDGHELSFTLQVIADGGGSWDIDVVVPVDCP